MKPPKHLGERLEPRPEDAPIERRTKPLCGTNVSLHRIHFHRYWTGVRKSLGFIPYAAMSETSCWWVCHLGAFPVQAPDRVPETCTWRALTEIQSVERGAW